jgi:hypothetical protein
MSFKEIRNLILKCLESGRYQHVIRRQINEKNLMVTGEVSVITVINLLKRTRGTEYESSAHHQVPDLDVHIFRPILRRGHINERWYIKCYFIHPDVWFISVHRSEEI